jgi:hypothetical protein
MSKDYSSTPVRRKVRTAYVRYPYIHDTGLTPIMSDSERDEWMKASSAEQPTLSEGMAVAKTRLKQADSLPRGTVRLPLWKGG